MVSRKKDNKQSTEIKKPTVTKKEMGKDKATGASKAQTPTKANTTKTTKASRAKYSTTSKAKSSTASKAKSRKTSEDEQEVFSGNDVWSLGNKDKFGSSNETPKQKKTVARRKGTTKKSSGRSTNEDTQVTEVIVENGTAHNVGYRNAQETLPAVPTLNTIPTTKVEFADLGKVLSDLPEDVIDNMPTIQNRINAYLTYFSAMSLSRLPRLFRFIDAAEEILFNPDDLLHLDFDQINSAYRNAKATANDTLENARKVTQTVQSDNDKKVDALYNMLTAMSPDTVSRMLEMANAAENEHKAAKEEEERLLKERQFNGGYKDDDDMGTGR